MSTSGMHHFHQWSSTTNLSNKQSLRKTLTGHVLKSLTSSVMFKRVCNMFSFGYTCSKLT